MMKDKIQIPEERMACLKSRYHNFLKIVDDPSTKPVKVFDPLSKKIVGEIELIREISRELQKKKVEDMIKAKEAAEEPAPVAENNETKEESASTPETEKKDE